MKLMAPETWAETRFIAQDRPSQPTVRRWCRDGLIPAKKIGTKWYVLAEEEQRETGDPLVDKVLEGMT